LEWVYGTAHFRAVAPEGVAGREGMGTANEKETLVRAAHAV